MTDSQKQFRSDAVRLLWREWKPMSEEKGDAAAWWWLESLTGWNDAHDWAVHRVQHSKTLALPFHLYLTDCIELAQDAAAEVLGSLPMPYAVRAKKAEEARLKALGKKRAGRPKDAP